MAAEVLDAIVICITLTGSEVFLAAVVLAAYWCWDRRIGAVVATAFLGSMWLNSVLKMVFRLPRPPMEPAGRVVSCLRGLLGAEGYGFPSGHTQGTATVWWTIAGLAGSRAIAAAAGAATVLVGLSRLYLRVHYPADVIGGAALGLAAALAASAASTAACARPPRVMEAGPVARIVAAAVVSLLALAGPVDEAVVKCSGFFLGFAAGAMLEPILCPFRRGGATRGRAARLAVGLICVLAADVALKAAIPAGLPWTWVRYAGMGLSATLIAPLAFVLVGVAEAEDRGA